MTENKNNDNQPITSKAKGVTGRKAQLTKIDQYLQDQASNTDGFAKAKLHANKALEENKIILNNRFVLQETLGAGGMGTVYLAQDLRKVEATDINPYVAVKVLSGDFKEHPDAFIALQREASRSSRLSHPNIVTVYDFDRDGDTVYMTMELLQGEDLDSYIRRNSKLKSNLPNAKRIILDYCRALHFAHQKGIYHCDLKPANIFVTKEGAKVLDFGIARLARETADHFDAGKIGALTPDYASIEMFNKQAPDQRDDVFAAAIIAYELMSGQHPFQNKSAISAKALGLKPEPIAGLSKREWRAIEQALELDRAKRTSSVLEFIKQFSPSKKQPTIAAIIGLSCITAIAFGYSIYKSNELNQKISQTMNKAESCFKDKNYQCAIDNTMSVLNLDSEHDSATLLLEQARELLTQEELNTKVNNLLSETTACLDDLKLDCAKEKVEEVLSIDSTNNTASKLKFDIEQKQAEILSSYKQLIEESDKCFSIKDFECANQKANDALLLIPKDERALAILQDVKNALEQIKLSKSKADSITKEGQDCYKKLDYSCAIAKAESALAFVENYQPAKKLKADAERALAKAKKSITIE
ncbi:MAG: serine/threonine protein kinase [Gammaproteobacteria bacterium]|nr:serine/threonine protein kinase [Gammaproteobacteria bacterium]